MELELLLLHEYCMADETHKNIWHSRPLQTWSAAHHFSYILTRDMTLYNVSQRVSWADSDFMSFIRTFWLASAAVRESRTPQILCRTPWKLPWHRFHILHRTERTRDIWLSLAQPILPQIPCRTPGQLLCRRYDGSWRRINPSRPGELLPVECWARIAPL